MWPVYVFCRVLCCVCLGEGARLLLLLSSRGLSLVCLGVRFIGVFFKQSEQLDAVAFGRGK